MRLRKNSTAAPRTPVASERTIKVKATQEIHRFNKRNILKNCPRLLEQSINVFSSGKKHALILSGRPIGVGERERDGAEISESAKRGL